MIRLEERSQLEREEMRENKFQHISRPCPNLQNGNDKRIHRILSPLPPKTCAGSTG
jgi:hypothetical protein